MFEFIDHDGEDQREIFLDHGILGNICSTKEVIAGLCYASERFEEVCEKREREKMMFYLTNCSSINDESHKGLMCDRRISQRPFKHLSLNVSDVTAGLPPAVSFSFVFFPFYSREEKKRRSRRGNSRRSILLSLRACRNPMICSIDHYQIE